MKGFLTVVLVGLLVAACGESPLLDLGGRSSGWIDDVRHSTTVPPSPTIRTEPTLVSVDEVDWWNEDLGPARIQDAPTALAEVAARRSGSDRFVQASPFEIAAVIPQVLFPSQLPDAIASITSQLVLATDANALDATQVAAFGLWTVEPYTQSRAVGQAGTLFVSRSAGGQPCVTDTACDLLLIGGVEVSRVVNGDEVTLAWAQGEWDYELSLHGSMAELFVDVLRSMAPLTDLLDVDATASSDTVGGVEG